MSCNLHVVNYTANWKFKWLRSRPQDFRSLLLDFQFNKFKELWWKGPSMDRETIPCLAS